MNTSQRILTVKAVDVLVFNFKDSFTTFSFCLTDLLFQS